MENQYVVIRLSDAAADTKRLSSIWFEASVKTHLSTGELRLAEQRRLIEEEYLPKAETWVVTPVNQAAGTISKTL